MGILWKGWFGGSVTAVIAWASKKGDVLPGTLPLAPTFAIIAFIAVGLKADPERFNMAWRLALSAAFFGPRIYS